SMARNTSRMPNEAVLHLCDLIAERAKLDPETSIPLCLEPNLGSAAQHLLVSKQRVMAEHLKVRLKQIRGMQKFVDGHTHQYELPWEVALGDLTKITVANTGAFQRLIDEKGFLARLKGRSPQEGLRTIELDELPPCYTAVVIPADAVDPEVRAWYMEED